MSLRIHIERLVIDGLPLDARNRIAFERAVKAEIHRRFIDSGVSLGSSGVGGLTRPPAVSMRLGVSKGPSAIGRQIGAAICSAIAPQRATEPGE